MVWGPPHNFAYGPPLPTVRACDRDIKRRPGRSSIHRAHKQIINRFYDQYMLARK